MSKAFATALAAFAAILVGSGVSAAAEVRGIEIVAYGIAESVKAGERSDNGNGIKLIRHTDSIPAITGTNFYIEYIVRGEPAGAAVKIEQVVMLLPVGVKNAADPDDFIKSRKALQNRIGEPHHAGWGLGPHEYIEPGNWKIQLWYDGRVMAEKVFAIVLP